MCQSYITHSKQFSILTCFFTLTLFEIIFVGFLSTGDSIAAGNYGLWDQLLALQFVKNNIKYFYGNPDRITIAGHDAGAASVGIHLLSPQSDRK